MSQLPTQKLVLKLFAAEGSAFDEHALVGVFHAWIKRNTLEEPLVDVAHYGHVHHGPSILLAGHESDYVIDEAEGRRGLVVRRKRAPRPASTDAGRDAALDDALRRLLRAAEKLEEDPALAGLRFSRDEIAVTFVDRLHAPNTAEAYDAVAPLVKASIEHALGAATLRRDVRDPRSPLTVHAVKRA